MRRAITIIIILAVLGVAGYFGFQQFGGGAEEAAEETETAVSEANTNPVSASLGIVSAEGQIVPLQDVSLSFQTGGLVSEIMVAEGDTVSIGDPLIQLDAASLELARDQAAAGVRSAEAALEVARQQLVAAQGRVATAEVGVTSAEAQLALAQAGPQSSEIAAAENNIAAAQASIVQAAASRDASLQIRDSQVRAAEANVAAQTGRVRAVEDQYEVILNDCVKVEVPTSDGGTEEKKVCRQYGPNEEAKRAELEQVRLELQAAQATLNALLSGPTFGQRAAASGGIGIAQANKGLAEAQLALLQAGATAEQIRQAEVGVVQAETAVEQVQVSIQQAEAGVAQAEAAVVSAQAGLDTAEAALAKTTLVATFAGTVGSVNVELGELVNPGVPMITIADFSGWQIKTTDLTELDVVSVGLGQAVDVQIDAVPDATISGTVSDIAAVSILSRGDVTYEVTIDIEPSDLPLRWGMTAFVDIDVE